MCIENERAPTAEEIASIKFGYKVFRVHANGTKGAVWRHRAKDFYWYTDQKKKADGFFSIRPAKIENNDSDKHSDKQFGFHVFPTLEAAQEYLREDVKHTLLGKFVIHKVEVGNLKSIGVQRIYYPDRDEFVPVVRCGRIKILEEINAD